MAKKKKKTRNQRHKVAALGSLSQDELWEKGNLYLNQEKYSEAIRFFKQLLKLKEDPEADQALLQAYLGRIKSLASKSMAKEAVALLQIVSDRWPDAKIQPLRLSLFLQTGNFTEAAGLYREYVNHFTSEQQERMDALFGALLLTGTGGLLPDNFVEDSPVVLFYPAALLAIDAVFDGQGEQGRNALKQIPLRSPYRHLRTLLTALLQFPDNKEKGIILLRKINKNSPYFSYAARYLATADSPEFLLQNLAGAQKPERREILASYELNPAQRKALEDLSQNDGQPHNLLHFVRNHQACFTKPRRLNLLGNILPHCGEQGLPFLARHTDLSLLEKNRLSALAAENDNVPSFAVDFWNDYLGSSSEWEPARYKEIGLVLRRMAKLEQRAGHYGTHEILDTMMESLKYDPDHAQTWLEASDLARQIFGLARHYRIIQDAVVKLPENVDILVAAMKACGRKGAHKKASGLAQRVLEIDPINISALDFLVESRLEHGRKLAIKKKWQLAEKELQRADTRVKAVRFRGRQQICLGMLLLLQGRKEGMQHIVEGRRENGFPLLSHILAFLESRLYKLPQSHQNQFARELRQLSAEITVDKSEFLRLVGWMLTSEEKQRPVLKESCDSLKKYLTRAASLDWSRDEGLSICKTFYQADLLSPLAKFSKSLHRKYREVIDFRVWELLSTYSDGKKEIPERIIEEIEDMMDHLMDRGRYELAECLEDLLDSSGIYQDHFFDDDDDDDDFDDDFDDFLDDLFNFGPFKMPEKKAKEDEPASQPKQPRGGKQLNLFDDIE